MTRDVLAATVNLARARGATPLIVVPHFGVEDEAERSCGAGSSTRRSCPTCGSRLTTRGASRGIGTRMRAPLTRSRVPSRLGCEGTTLTNGRPERMAYGFRQQTDCS